MRQVFKELLVLFIVTPISIGIIIFAMQKAEQSREVLNLTAVIEKKELVISSPVFGSIEQFPFEEGDVVKANSTIAVINIIDQKESPELQSDVYVYNKQNGTITIKSPVDAVVAKKELAEKSTIKPEANLIILHPLSNTLIKIQTKDELPIKTFDSTLLTDKQSSFSLPIVFSKKLPVSDKTGMIYYYASFVDQAKADSFYENQHVIVRVKKKPNALTGKLDSLFSQVGNLDLIKNLPFN